MSDHSKSSGFYCPAFDGLRCLLLLSILEFHYGLGRVALEKIWWMSFALPCFFVLSGYLISHILYDYRERMSRGQTLKAFYVRRALRILPAFYAVLLVAHLVGGVPYLGWQLAYVFNFKLFALSDPFNRQAFYEFMGHVDFNGAHLWSMAVEEQFYVLYPLFVLLLPRRSQGWLLALGIAVSAALRLYLLDQHPHTCYGVLTPVAGEFILWGCLVAWLESRDLLKGWNGTTCFYAGLAFFALLVVTQGDVENFLFAQWKPPANMTFFGLALALVVFGLRHSPDQWYSRLLMQRPLRAVGKIAYGAYLLHPFLNPMVDAVLVLLPWLAMIPGMPRALLGPVFAIGAAALMWVSFEGPLNRLRDRVSPLPQNRASEAEANSGNRSGEPTLPQ
ncbi:MAG: acyltransferase family protein [Vulcanimicrobiota bacterium]